MDENILSKISNVEPALLESILLGLNVKDILQVCGSDKNRYNICNDNQFWLKKIYHDYTHPKVFIHTSEYPNLSIVFKSHFLN